MGKGRREEIKQERKKGRTKGRKEKKKKKRRNKNENWESETKYAFFPRRCCSGSKKSIARAVRRICALVSGDLARRLETVFLGRRRLAGMMDGSVVSLASVSISREQRPR